MHFGLKCPPLSFAGCFGRIHGQVGVAEQILGLAEREPAGFGKPDARARNDALPADIYRVCQGADNPLSQPFTVIGRDLFCEDRELVPAEPGHGVTCSNNALEPRSDLAE